MTAPHTQCQPDIVDLLREHGWSVAAAAADEIERLRGVAQAPRLPPTENAIHNTIASALANGTTYSNVRQAARDVLALMPTQAATSCKHSQKFGSGTISTDGSGSPSWHCKDCGAAGKDVWGPRAPVSASPDRGLTESEKADRAAALADARARERAASPARASQSNSTPHRW